MKEKKSPRPDWGKLFQQMLELPGKMPEYYSMFHKYSMRNQALAIAQMRERGIPIGPISSFNGWKKLGRKVKKGERAIALWMPVILKEDRPDQEDSEEEAFVKEVFARRFFVMKKLWFAFAQTEPVDPDHEVIAQVAKPPEWDKATALSTLGIREVEFSVVDGNIQGFARSSKMEIAISPIAAMPWRTLFHEIAHCLLHSDEALMADGLSPDRRIKEAEAEAVAYLCCANLGLPGQEDSRAYIQYWLGSEQREEFTKKSAARVFAAADKILKAGTSSGKKEDCHE